MTIQDLGSLGELIAAVATVATLVYLAVQIRQNTRSVRAAAFHATSSLIAQFMSMVNGDQELSRIFRLGLADSDSLDPDAHDRFMGTLIQLFSYFQDVFHQYQEGLLDAELWESRRTNLVA